VFGAIQRFFPGFFPSCFTEQRQNLLQLYENAEYSEFTINENWKVRMKEWIFSSPELIPVVSHLRISFRQEKISRLIEAFLYSFANTSRTLYTRLSGQLRGDEPTDKTEKDQ
jgi:hypothetical protein